jgi:hypothetical protein
MSCTYTAQGFYKCDKIIEGYANGFTTNTKADTPIPNGTIPGCESCVYTSCQTPSHCIVKCNKCFKSQSIKNCSTPGNCIMKQTDPCANYPAGKCPSSTAHIDYKNGNKLIHIPCSRNLFYESSDPTWQSATFKQAKNNCLDTNYKSAILNVMQEQHS